MADAALRALEAAVVLAEFARQAGAEPGAGDAAVAAEGARWRVDEDLRVFEFPRRHGVGGERRPGEEPGLLGGGDAGEGDFAQVEQGPGLAVGAALEVLC